MKKIYLLLLILISTLSSGQYTRQVKMVYDPLMTSSSVQFLYKTGCTSPYPSIAITGSYIWTTVFFSCNPPMNTVITNQWNVVLPNLVGYTNGWQTISSTDNKLNSTFFNTSTHYYYDFNYYIVFGNILSTDSFNPNSLSIYPNPTKDLLHIDLQNELSGKITDLTGKILMTINTKDIDVSSLSAGIYLLDIVSEEKHYVSKIVKE